MRKKFFHLVFNSSAALAVSTACLCLSAPASQAASEAERQFDIGCNQMMQKKFNDAIGSFTGAIAEKANDSNYYFRRGQCFFCLQKVDEAILDFERAINIESGNPQIYLWRGSAYARLKKDELAIRDYEKAMRLDPGLTEAYRAGQKDKKVSVKVSGSSTGTGSVTKSDVVISPPSTGSPTTHSDDKSEPVAGSGQAAISEVSESKVETVIDTASSAKSETGKPATGSGSESGSSTAKKTQTISLGANDNAVKDYAEAYERAMKNLVGYFRFGTVYSGMTAPDGSEIIIGNYKLDPAVVQVEKKDGADFYSLKNAGKDMRSYDEKVNNSPNAAPLYFGRGQAYEQLGNKEQALADFSRAIDLDKKNAYFVLARAFYYHQQGKDDLAHADIKLAQEIDPTVPVDVKFEKPAQPHADSRTSEKSSAK